jgi:hypothetical protein
MVMPSSMRLGVVGADLAADAVFERRDDLAARGVVLGVGGEDDGDVELEADGVALNLHVALLHDVEERDLDFAGEVGELVDGEDAAVGAGQQAVVHGELGAEFLAGARGLDGVDVADEVGYRHVGGGELFDVAVVGVSQAMGVSSPSLAMRSRRIWRAGRRGCRAARSRRRRGSAGRAAW